MGSSAVVGLLTGGGFLFLSAILVPVLTRRLNRSLNEANEAEVITKAAAGAVALMKDERDAARKDRAALQAWARKKALADAEYAAEYARWIKALRDKFEKLVTGCRDGGIELSEDDFRLDDPPSPPDVPFYE